MCDRILNLQFLYLACIHISISCNQYITQRIPGLEVGAWILDVGGGGVDTGPGVHAYRATHPGPRGGGVDT